MYCPVHPSSTMLRGDDRGYNPREIRVAVLPNGRELITGVFRDDGRIDNALRRPDRQFRILVPPAFEAWWDLNTHVFRALRANTAEGVIDFR